jgi:L-glyceraldehyde 3-phosphate reductase
VMCFSPLAQGLLSDKYLKGIPEDSRASLGKFLGPRQITEKVVGKIGQLNSIAQSRGQSLAQMALAWVLRFQSITSVLIGASRPSQINENVLALDNSNIDAILKT